MVQHDLIFRFLAKVQICRNGINSVLLTILRDHLTLPDLVEILHTCLNWSKPWEKLWNAIIYTFWKMINPKDQWQSSSHENATSAANTWLNGLYISFRQHLSPRPVVLRLVHSQSYSSQHNVQWHDNLGLDMKTKNNHSTIIWSC